MREISGVSKKGDSDADVDSRIRSADLNETQVTQYLSDLVHSAQDLSIQVKDSARSDFRPMDRLGELHVLMLHKHIWSAQITYKHNAAQWVDTLIVGVDGIRIVRVKQEESLSA